jgi:hypothetical protein
LEKALPQANKENAALLKKHKLSMKDNNMLAAEREVLSRAVGDKVLTKRMQRWTARTKAPGGRWRLQRNATHREMITGELQDRLQNTSS